MKDGNREGIDFVYGDDPEATVERVQEGKNPDGSPKYREVLRIKRDSEGNKVYPKIPIAKRAHVEPTVTLTKAEIEDLISKRIKGVEADVKEDIKGDVDVQAKKLAEELKKKDRK